MASSIEFLKHILPDEGYYVSHTITNAGPRYNTFHQTIDGLANYLFAEDAKGHTVYHACASYRENRSNPRNTPPQERRLGRTHHNVLWLASLWGDVDAGPGKPYPHRDAAMEAVWNFCRSADLPHPTLVGSGTGLHIYWPLNDFLWRDLWLPYANGLRALFNQKGLAVDQHRTSDVTSILRTPGTHWRKDGVREVVCGTLNGPYDNEIFERIKDVREPGQPPKYVNGHRSQRLVADALVLFNNDKADGERVADHCKQIGDMRATSGNVREPHWYAVLGVLAHCEDGDRLGHAWSAGYDGYTFEETQAKLERARTFGPTTCEKFAAVNPAGCVGCPYQGQITSPIELGRHRASLAIEPSKYAVRGSEEPNGHDPSSDKTTFSQIKLPPDFKWGANGALVALSEHAKGAIIEHVISEHPLYLARLQVGEAGGTYSMTFMHRDTARAWFPLTMSSKSVFGSQVAADFFDKGSVVIHDVSNFQRYVRGHLDMLKQEQSQQDIRYDQYGWKNNDTAFLYGLNLYGPDGVKPVSGSRELEHRAYKYEVGPAPNASLEAWTQCADKVFAEGAEPQSVAMLASFGAPLMRLCDATEGGSIVHIVTAASGKGKSQALLGAYSVWGQKWGVSSHTNDTKVSKGVNRAALSNLPVFNDEFTIKDPDELQRYVTDFTDGRDRQRANRAGELIHNERSWQTILISASNSPLTDKLRDDAMRWRVIELSSHLPPDVQLAQGEEFKRILLANAGIAGDVYLRWLTRPQNLAWAKEQLKKYRVALYEDPRFKDPVYRYWVRTLACMMVAGSICTHLGLLHMNTMRVINWLIGKLPFEGGKVQAWQVETLNDYLRAKARTGTVVVPGPWQPGDQLAQHVMGSVQLPAHEPLIRYEIQTGRYYIAVRPFMNWLIEQNKGYRELVSDLEEMKIIIDNKLATLTAGTGMSAPQVRCLVVDGKHPSVTETKS